MNKSDCIFCKIAAGKIKTEKIADTDNFIVINDANPIAEGHCLIISKNHYENVLDLPTTLGIELLDLTKKQSARLIKEHKAEGINLVQNNFKAAGQIVKHYHLHIIPRKMGDNVKLG